MNIDELLTENALRSLRDARVKTYLDRAVNFLTVAYGDDNWLNGPVLRRNFAQDCYDLSHELGIQRTRAHLRFLSHSVILGFGFERNPIFRNALRRAGWLNARGTLNPAPDTDALTSFVNRWSAISELECSQPDFALSAYLEAGRYGSTLSHAGALAVLQDAWPDRTAITPALDLEDLVSFALGNAAQQRMPADISAVFVILSLHLGAFFFRDARYSMLAQAFLYRDTGEAARRDAVSDVICMLADASS